MPFPEPSCEVPWIDTDQMIEVDRAMIEDYRIGLIQMMENAGRCLALVAHRRFLGGDPTGPSVAVLAGTGGNGGGAITCGRRLACWGAKVTIAVTNVERITEVPGRQLDIARRMGLAITDAAGLDGLDRVDLVIDGIIGYSLAGAPRGPAAQMIEWAGNSAAPILSLDVPSGIDTASGTAYQPGIRATATTTLALPKVGLRGEAARPRIGELYLADISVPPQLYRGAKLGLEVGPIFARSDVVRLAV